ncbi:MAG: SDR family oxidoreductase [Dehalococcoidia bacterium]
MTRKLRDSVMVITGASSGIGRATALAAARRGSTVVLAARREQALQELASECQGLGGRALAVQTDVRNEEAVRNLARRAIENYGRIDVWVNNAAVTLFARFEEAPPDIYRQVFETNLFGQIHGARAVLPYFREQGSGVLINLSSVVAKVGQPYASAYVTTKHAIRGFSECLRQEVLDADDIHVCTILPAAIDTPLYQQAANYTGRAPKPMNPVYSAEKVAEAIISCAEHPKREVEVGGSSRAIGAMRAVAPGMSEKAAAKAVEKDHFTDTVVPPGPGNVLEPVPEWAEVSGGWQTTGEMPTGKIAAGAAGAAAVSGMAVAGWLWMRNRDDGWKKTIRKVQRK